MCVATNLTHSRRSWVIHVIPAISTCPVHPKSGRSAGVLCACCGASSASRVGAVGHSITWSACSRRSCQRREPIRTSIRWQRGALRSGPYAATARELRVVGAPARQCRCTAAVAISKSAIALRGRLASSIRSIKLGVRIVVSREQSCRFQVELLESSRDIFSIRYPVFFKQNSTVRW